MAAADTRPPAAAALAPHPDQPPFRVIALVAAFNEGDIIGPVLSHLISQGIDVYLLDNCSTDDTVERARPWLGRGLLRIESFPPGPDPCAGRSVFAWGDILRRKEELARELDADWFIHHDADEIREGPLPGLTLREAIRWVDGLGYNCIDHLVFNFVPTDDEFVPGSDPVSHFQLYREAAEYDRLQLKAWKRAQDVTLVSSGGHQAEFAGRHVFPVPFIIRHYPIRSQAHGLRKVFTERKGRFVEAERSLGWHRQYDDADDPTHRFTVGAGELPRFDLERIRLDSLLPGALARQLAERLERADRHLEEVRSASAREQIALRRHVGNLEFERDELRAHAANLEVEREELKAHAGNLEAEISGLRLDAANLREQRDGLSQHIANLERIVGELDKHRSNLESELQRLGAEEALLRNALGETKDAHHDLRQAYENAMRELDTIRASPAWRLITGLRRVAGTRSGATL